MTLTATLRAILFSTALAAPLAALDLATIPVDSKEIIDTSTLTFTPWEKANPTVNVKAALKNKIEKTTLKFGMIKLTDCIPIVAARELGYFAEEGLNVQVLVQPNWKAVNDNLLSGEIDGSHMLHGHPLGDALGIGGKGEVIVPYNISINGMGLTVSNGLWKEVLAKKPEYGQPGYAVPLKADVFKAIAEERLPSGNPPLTMFMTYVAGSHNMNIRYWLAAGGVSPGFYDGPSDPKGSKGSDIVLTVNPPPQMASAMAAGNCDAFCVGEPWNMQVTFDKNGRMAAPSQYIFDGSPDKVFGMTKAFADANPNTVIAVTKALIRAGIWLDANKANRKTAVEMLAHKDYIGAKPEIMIESMLGSLVYNFDGGKVDRRAEPEFNVFSRRYAAFPWQSHAVWVLTQFRRWGLINESKPDSFYHDLAKKTYRTDLYRAAYAKLLEEGKAPAEGLPKDDMQSYPASAFIDGIAFDPAKPNEYLSKFAIGLK